MIDHSKAPLWEALNNHISYSHANFHVPGHKAGQMFDHLGAERYSNILPIDLTEVGELDDLHVPTGVINEAQILAADAFGASHTRFLVGGTTAGILSSILAVCKPGDKIIAARHCHQSVFHGCFLAGATVVPIPYEIDKNSGLEKPVAPHVLKRILEKHPDTKAVILTSPTYFGVVQQIKALADIVHQYQIPFIVDEAHGAHFGFHPELPRPAIWEGADICIQSTHKMLPAMTMSSMLHIRDNLVEAEKIDIFLKMIQSSSPSYPLMASLDLARRYMMLEGEMQLSLALNRIGSFRNKIQKLGIEEKTMSSVMDPMKLSLASTYHSGYELAKELEKRGIFAELADDQKVLFVFSLGTQQAELDYLYHSLLGLMSENYASNPKNKPTLLYPIEGEILPYDECRTKERCLIPVEKSIGMRSATHLVPCPPGIPLVLMGETIHQEVIDYLLFLISSGEKVRGFIKQQGTYWLHVYTK